MVCHYELHLGVECSAGRTRTWLVEHDRIGVDRHILGSAGISTQIIGQGRHGADLQQAARSFVYPGCGGRAERSRLK
jgi:hypothetical protein